jgi:hypothetical protein
MSAVTEILADLSSRGVTVRADGVMLRLRPKAALDDRLLARVQAHKPDILAVLSAVPAACSPTCYEIEPGKWIHHPWDKCETCLTPDRGKLTQSESACGHCGGTDECDCITCGRFETVWRPGRCIPCEARRRERVQ